jgi:hypothetical protein
MAYQLRFEKSLPLNVWLKETACQLEPLLTIYNGPSPGSPLSTRRKFHHIRRALAKGFSSFLMKRSLCDVDEDCDIGLNRAPENTRFGISAEGLFARRVNRYPFKKEVDVPDSIQALAESLLAEFPFSARETPKIKGLLKDRLMPHLFDNPKCFNRDTCRHTYSLNLARDMALLPSHCPIPSPRKSS